ncbi:MAG: hypothetical protein ACUVWP_01945 [bacterium]
MIRRIIFLSAILIVSYVILYNETPKEVLSYYVNNSGEFYRRDIQSLPNYLLPNGIDGLFILPYESKDGEITLYLVGEKGVKGDSDWRLYDLGIVKFSGSYNSAKADVYYNESDGLIYITSQMPFSAYYYGAKYKWNKESVKLTLVEEWEDDPSARALEEVNALLEDDKISEAGDKLMSIFYPGHYYNDYEMTCKFLRSAHNFALSSYKKGQIKNACKYYKDASKVFELTVGSDWYMNFNTKEDYINSEYNKYMKFDDFIEAINDYGFFLEQAGEVGDAIYILNAVVMLSPDRVVAHLNLGDAYLKCRNKEKARSEYLKYIKIMTEKGLIKEIPERVWINVK